MERRYVIENTIGFVAVLGLLSFILYPSISGAYLANQEHKDAIVEGRGKIYDRNGVEFDPTKPRISESGLQQSLNN